MSISIADRMGLLESFGDIPDMDWAKMERPYITVFNITANTEIYRGSGMKYGAKLYDGANYTGYHRAATNIYAIIDDIARHHPELNQYQRGAEDPEELIWVYG